MKTEPSYFSNSKGFYNWIKRVIFHYMMMKKIAIARYREHKSRMPTTTQYFSFLHIKQSTFSQEVDTKEVFGLCVCTSPVNACSSLAPLPLTWGHISSTILLLDFFLESSKNESLRFFLENMPSSRENLWAKTSIFYECLCDGCNLFWFKISYHGMEVDCEGSTSHSYIS